MAFPQQTFLSTYFGFGTVFFEAALQPNVTFEECGVINDWNGGTISATQFATNCQTVITYEKTHGDVILVTPNPSAVSTHNRAYQNAFIQEMYNLATTNNIPLIDLWNRAPTWEQLNTYGEEFNTLHPNGLGDYILPMRL